MIQFMYTKNSLLSVHSKKIPFAVQSNLIGGENEKFLEIN
jgi:hypothetical protein